MKNIKFLILKVDNFTLQSLYTYDFRIYAAETANEIDNEITLTVNNKNICHDLYLEQGQGLEEDGEKL